MNHHILHNLGEPQTPIKFTHWRTLLEFVRDNAITGYGVDMDGSVVNFQKGKRENYHGRKPRWVVIE